MMGAAISDRMSQADRTAILVIGMHRSGTSMMSGILNYLGCSTPAHLMPANADNERGYYESALISKLNDDILTAAGTAWNSWRPIAPAWFQSPQAEALRDQAGALLDTEFGAEPLFLLKDPRICRIMPFWRQVLEDRGIAPRVLHIHRNPVEVAASLEKRDAINPAYGQLLWLFHTLDVEAQSRDLPRHYTSYPKVMTQWRAEIDAAGAALDISWPCDPEEVSDAVQAFVSPDLKHFNAETQEMQGSAPMASWIRDVSKIFEGWAQGQTAQDDADRLDAIRAEAAQASVIFAPLLDAVVLGAVGQKAGRKATARRMEDLGARLKTAQTCAKETKRALEKSHIACIVQEAAAEEKAVALAAARKVCAAQEAAADADAAKIADLGVRNARLQQAVERSASDLTGLRAETSRLTKRVAALTSAQARLNAEHEKLLHKTLEDARAQMEALIYNNEQMRQSTSWRITAPLRWLIGRIR